MYDMIKCIHILILVQMVLCLDFQVQLMSFDVKLLGNQNEKGGNSIHLRALEDSKEKPNLRAVDSNKTRNNWRNFNLRTVVSKEIVKEIIKKPALNITQKKVTVQQRANCEYEYPGNKQMEVILSNMMNELTQVFVKANDWLKEKITRRTRMLHNAEDIRRALESRFSVSHRKRTNFFDDIYHNMTNDYRSFYNFTAQRAMRSGADPCKHQKEIKKLWSDLLERSLLTLKQAIHHCIEEYLKDQDIDPTSTLGVRVNNYLVKEMGIIRTNELKLLCEKFQLCYDEILKDFRWKSNMRADEFRRARPYYATMYDI